MLLNRKIPIYYIINTVKYDIVFVLIVSLVVVLLTNRFQHFLPEMPLTIPAFIGTAISILLSFKLNQSYERWWEARKVWGSIVNDSRSFILQLTTYTLNRNDELVKKIAFRQIGWCYSLGQALRGLDPTENLERFISAEELSQIKSHINKPLALLQAHGNDLRTLKQDNQLELFSQIQLMNTVERFCESQGMAERIKNTVFPVTYRVFLHLIIYLFVITLSIALKYVPGYFEIPLLLMISSAFFLLEKSATHMQDPFENRPTDTAVTSIARAIEINIRQLLKEEDMPAPVQPSEYYLL